jgi:ubiquinone/menaquinone biosynthesis C-methylase UbiE
MTTARTAFDSVAAAYDTYRPSYPDPLFEALESYAGPLADARVLDLAAGTGIATRQLVQRGARVVASDLGAEMLRVLQARSPDVPVVRSRGEALPFRDASFDVITCATAWHWIPLKRRGAEALRVLRPGGTLAVWWAFGGLEGDDDLAQREREIYQKWKVGELPLVTPTPEVADETTALPEAGFGDLQTPAIEGSRSVSVAEHIGHLSTHSPVLALRDDLPRFQADLLAASDGRETVVEGVHCHVVLARKPR